MYYVSRPINMWCPDEEIIELVKVSTEPKLTYVASALPEEDRCYSCPIEAARAIIKIQSQHWKESSNKKKIKIVVGEEPVGDMSVIYLETRLSSKLMKWANNEYNTLRKCKRCRKILNEQGNRNGLQNHDEFCSSACKDSDHQDQIKSMNDNDESEFFL